jgi:signal transduction histidine kinase/CheY-like chemotaxis protein
MPDGAVGGSVVITRPVEASSGISRYILARIPAEKLSEIVSSLTSLPVLKEGHYALYTSDGETVFASGKGLKGFSVRDAIQSVGKGIAVYDVSLNGVSILTKSAGVAHSYGNPWILAIQVPYAQILAPMRTAFLSGLTLFSIATLFAVWSARRLSSRLTHPIDAMQLAVQNMSHGDYEKAKSLPDFDDELGILAKDLALSAASSERLMAQMSAHESELRRARDEALQANVAKSAFLANMSHEIRTPLNGILGFAQTLDEGALSPEQKEMSRMMVESGQSLMVVINDILDVSKIESGKMTLESTNFSVSAVIQSISMMFETNFRRRNVQLRVESRVREEEETIVGDPHRIKQIMINLLSNALKFTENGSVTWRVHLEDDQTGGLTLVTSIEDQGIGMTEEQAKNLFKPFTQADTSVTRRFGGTGLGLSIVKSLIDLMKGTIEVESMLGKGTKFGIRIPTRTGERDQVLAVDRTLRRENKEQIAQLKVLVVEDNVVNQKVARAIFGKIGVKIDVAENGLVGVDMLENGAYDAVFMDLQMPVMDGLTAAKTIVDKYNAARRSLPIMAAMTANVFVEDRARCLEAGLKEFVPKPIRRDDIERVLSLALNVTNKIVS